jgi:hypothetical protein
MNILQSVDMIKGLVHLFIKLVPIGLYFFTYFSSILYKDYRSVILMVGLIFNDIIGFLYNKYSNIIFNESCAVFDNIGGKKRFLPNYHTEIISFVTSFFYTEIWAKGGLPGNWFKFLFLLFMVIMTVWSRMSIGCESSYQKIVFNLLFGMIRGSLFYYFFSSYYQNLDENKDNIEKECSKEFSDYTCESIKNGNVIVKKPLKKQLDDADNDTDNDTESEYD